MTRTEAIALIRSEVDKLDDGDVLAMANIVRSMSGPVRPLSERELGLLAQSRADFAAGRTLTHDEAKARTAAFLTRRRETHAKS